MIYGGAKSFFTLNIIIAMSCSLRVYSVGRLALCKKFVKNLKPSTHHLPRLALLFADGVIFVYLMSENKFVVVVVVVVVSCSGRTISLHHPFTPSLRVRHLETRQRRGHPYERAGNTRQKIQM